MTTSPVVSVTDELIAELERYSEIPSIAALLAEREELKRDAARYRWLRDGCDHKRSEATRIAVNLYGLEWDMAIDAAMQS